MENNTQGIEPLISIIISTHNRAQLVAEAVMSAVNQTYRKTEIIVVDDGSTDNTGEVLERYAGEIKYIYQPWSERSRARNEGFRQSKGKYIAFLDSDDVWHPEKVARQAQVLNEKPEVGVVYSDVQFIDINGHSYVGGIAWDLPERSVLYEDLMTKNVITGTTSSIMVRRECLDKVGLFDETMNTCEDLDLYRRIARYYDFYKIEMPLVKFRIHAGNTQKDSDAMARGWEAFLEKVSEDTPLKYKYYKNEAIVKILAQIARTYKEDGRLDRFLFFCIKSFLCRRNWILQCDFWVDVVRLSLRKISRNLGHRKET